MDEADRTRLATVLAFPDDVAGGLMSTDTISIRAGSNPRCRHALSDGGMQKYRRTPTASLWLIGRIILWAFFQ
jgi:hypothetical protein